MYPSLCCLRIASSETSLYDVLGTLTLWGESRLYVTMLAGFNICIMVELCWLCAHHMFLKVNHVPIVL